MFDGLIGFIILIIIFYKIIDLLIRQPRISDNSDRYVLITGAARGFGYEAAVRFDRLGCHVLAGVRNEQSAERLRGECSKRLHVICMDVCDQVSIERAKLQVQEILNKADKKLWAVVNNAGLSGFCHPEFLKYEDYEQLLKVNSLGVMAVTMAFLPLLKQSGGRIVNISSGAGRVGRWFFPHYNMSKFALEGYSDSMRRALKMYGVQVILIEPGLYKTDMADTSQSTAQLDTRWAQVSQELKQELGADYPDKLRELVSSFSRVASDRVYEVIDVYEHAVLARYPKPRYVVGTSLKYLWIPLEFLPEWFSDFVGDKLAPMPTPAVLKKK